MISASQTGLKKNRMDWILFFSVLTLIIVGTLAIKAHCDRIVRQRARVPRGERGCSGSFSQRSGVLPVSRCTVRARPRARNGPVRRHSRRTMERAGMMRRFAVSP